MATKTEIVPTLSGGGVPAVPPIPAEAVKDTDALALSLAAQANAMAEQSNVLAAQALWMTWGGVVIGLIALIFGLSWAVYVKLQAEKMARAEAAEWMKANAHPIIADEAAKLHGAYLAQLQAQQAAQEADLAEAE